MYTQGKRVFENVPITIVTLGQEEDDVNVSGEVMWVIKKN